MINLLEEAKRIIGISSITYESNLPLVEYVCSLLKPLGCDIQKQKGTHYGKDQINLIAQKGPASGKSLLLNTHLDTVSAGDFSLWDKTGGNPFRATIHEDKIYGLGTADVKLDLLCKIKALEKFKADEFKNPFILVGTYGEESGLIGAKQILESKIINPTYAVVGEPSNLNIIYAHKGHLVLEICFEDKNVKALPSNEKILRVDFLGKSAHSSTPHLGENAIENLFSFLKTQKDLQIVSTDGGELVNVIAANCVLKAKTDSTLLSKHNAASEEISTPNNVLFSKPMTHALVQVSEILKKEMQIFKKTPLDTFDPPHSLLSCNVIKTHQNQIHLEVSVRTLPNLEADHWFEALVQEIKKVKQNQEDINISIQKIRESKPMATPLQSTLVRESRHCLQQLGLQDIVTTKATSTEASIYAQMGAEAIVWGPGVSQGNVHRPNEFNYVHHLNQAVRFYEKLIESFCIRGV